MVNSNFSYPLETHSNTFKFMSLQSSAKKYWSLQENVLLITYLFSEHLIAIQENNTIIEREPIPLDRLNFIFQQTAFFNERSPNALHQRFRRHINNKSLKEAVFSGQHVYFDDSLLARITSEANSVIKQQFYQFHQDALALFPNNASTGTSSSNPVEPSTVPTNSYSDLINPSPMDVDYPLLPIDESNDPLVDPQLNSVTSEVYKKPWYLEEVILMYIKLKSEKCIVMDSTNNIVEAKEKTINWSSILSFMSHATGSSYTEEDCKYLYAQVLKDRDFKSVRKLTSDNINIQQSILSRLPKDQGDLFFHFVISIEARF
ncbi:MAG: hypothetical protein P4L16_04470 [Chlamydiales bacterium]|nr:hypothetical protein [Chlamydiales bacterium]